ncbi:hypothetical protein JW766_02165 [Candidatus Dojkabacteria bacterium]|nr:hypothetical protein [Candidatus Dojkabacteria bacterium]
MESTETSRINIFALQEAISVVQFIYEQARQQFLSEDRNSYNPWYQYYSTAVAYAMQQAGLTRELQEGTCSVSFVGSYAFGRPYITDSLVSDIDGCVIVDDFSLRKREDLFDAALREFSITSSVNFLLLNSIETNCVARNERMMAPLTHHFTGFPVSSPYESFSTSRLLWRMTYDDWYCLHEALRDILNNLFYQHLQSYKERSRSLPRSPGEITAGVHIGDRLGLLFSTELHRFYSELEFHRQAQTHPLWIAGTVVEVDYTSQQFSRDQPYIAIHPDFECYTGEDAIIKTRNIFPSHSKLPVFGTSLSLQVVRLPKI